MTRSYAVQNPTRRPRRPSGESSTSASAATLRAALPQMAWPNAPVVGVAPVAPNMNLDLDMSLDRSVSLDLEMSLDPSMSLGPGVNSDLPPPPPAVGVQTGVEGEANSDSEYETDPDAEPEEFYLSVDLTIPTPIHAGPSSNPHANAAAAATAIPPPLPLSSTTRSGRSGRRHLPSRPTHSHPHHPSTSIHPPHPAPEDDVPNQVARWAGGDGGRLQLLDLHTENPLVSFNNRIWSGSWMGTVGTEMYILCPEGPAPEDSVEVRGVYISQKDTSAAAAATTGAPVGAAGTISDAPGAGTDPDVGRVIAVSATRIHCLPAVVTAKERRFGVEDETRTYGWRPGKSTFLERLETIQIAKGERKPRGEEEEEESSEEESVEAEGTAFQQRMDGAGSSDSEVGSEQDENEGESEGEDHGTGEAARDVERANAPRATALEKERLEKEGYFAVGWEAGKGKPKEVNKNHAGEGPSSLPAR